LHTVLLHELAHIRRRDVLIHWLAAIAGAIHWFNPLARLTTRRLAALQELACDDDVLSRLEPSLQTCYGRAIVKVAKSLHAPSPLPTALGAAHSLRLLEERIVAITHHRPSSRLAGCLACLLLGALIATGLTDGVARQTADAGQTRPNVPANESAAGSKTASRKRQGDSDPIRVFGRSLSGDGNGLRTPLVWIPPGEFLMGSLRKDNLGFANEDQVQVTLTRGFWLGQHEVTQPEWQRVMHATPWSGKPNVKVGADFPATYISWDDAMAMCKKLTEQERGAHRLPNGWKYSLPTEAQWEYACRAGTKSRYSFGDSDKDVSDYAWWGWFGGISRSGNTKNEPYAHQVGQKKPNPWELYDMHGNVWEWCRDVYQNELIGGVDHQGPAEEGEWRVDRGGSFDNFAQRCRSASREGSRPYYRDNTQGFRLAIVPSGE